MAAIVQTNWNHHSVPSTATMYCTGGAFYLYDFIGTIWAHALSARLHSADSGCGAECKINAAALCGLHDKERLCAHTQRANVVLRVKC